MKNIKGDKVMTPSINFYGTGTIGEKGQIVIPIKVREKLEIKPGEDFIFFGHGKVIGLARAQDFEKILNKMSEKLTKGVSSLKDIKKQVKKR